MELITEANQTESWLFEKANKVNKPSARLKMAKEKTQFTKELKKGNSTTDDAGIKRIIEEY